MFESSSQGQSPEDAFLNRFNILSQMLLEDNYTNMKNLNHNNQNFNQIFSYLKGVVRQLISRCQKLEEINKELQEQLRKIDKSNEVLRKVSKLQRNQIGEIGFKFSNFVPLQAKKVNSFASKVVVSVSEGKQKQKPKPDTPENIRKEFQFIENFISKHLVNHLIEDRQRKSQIPKNLLVTCYLKWCQSKSHQILINKKMLIKMHITNVLKRIYPNIEHTDKHYKGLAFKKDIVREVEIKKESEERIDLSVGGGEIEYNQVDSLVGQDRCELEGEDFDHLAFGQFQFQNDYGQNSPES